MTEFLIMVGALKVDDLGLTVFQRFTDIFIQFIENTSIIIELKEHLYLKNWIVNCMINTKMMI